MIELTGMFEAGKEVLSLTATLTKLIQSDDEHWESLHQVLQKLKTEAGYISSEFRFRLRETFEDFEKNQINIDRSFEALLSDLSWYSVVTRTKLKNSRDRFYQMHRQLAAFIDDVNALLICSGTLQNATDAFTSGLRTKRRLDQLMLERPTIKKMILEMMKLAEELDVILVRA